MAKIQSLNGTAGKETIYVDVDDEITAIIDKVQVAKGKVVALVLPKRAPVLQSIVNMKLLQRTAANAGKNLVLVTGEAGLMPLAGAVGLFVASSPTSKPSIPSAPVAIDDGPEDADEPLSIVDGTANTPAGNTGGSATDDFDAKAMAGKTVGELAGAAAVSKAAAAAGESVDESIDMNDPDVDDDPSAASDANGVAPLPKLKKNSKLKVPNFDSFRKRLALGIVGVMVLIAGWVFAFRVLPKATVTIHTDTSTVTTNLNLTLDTNAKALNASTGVVPATSQSQQKTSSQQVASTGQQNNGAKAAGKVKFTIQKCSGSGTPSAISTGTSIKSSGGKTYILQEEADFSFSSFAAPCAQITTPVPPALPLLAARTPPVVARPMAVPTTL
jgi:hypothetical protein